MNYEHYLAHKELTSAIHKYNSTYLHEVCASITLADGSKFITPSELLPESEDALADFMVKIKTQYPGLEFDVLPVNWVTPPKRVSELLNLPLETVRERMHFIAKSANLPIASFVDTPLTESQFNYFKTGNKDLLWTSQPSE